MVPRGYISVTQVYHAAGQIPGFDMCIVSTGLLAA